MFVKLASEVAKTHEGYHHATDRNLRQGPQHTSRSGEVYVFHPMPVCLDTVMLQLHSTQRLCLTRRGEPVAAPMQRQSCQCALPTAAQLPTWKCERGRHSLPGTATSPSGNAGPIKLLRTVTRACSILAYLPHQSDAAILLLHCTIAQLVDSLSCQQVLQSTAGLSRIEPLLFLRRESVALRDPNSVRSTFLKVLDPILWSTLHFSTPLRPNHRRPTFTTAATVCLGCGLSLNITCETYNLHWALRVTCTIEMFVTPSSTHVVLFIH